MTSIKLTIIHTVLWFALLTDPANAEWAYNRDESAFSGEVTSMALTAKGKSALVIGCKAGKFSIIYSVPSEKLDITSFNAAKPVLKLRIDKNEVVEFPAIATSSSDVDLILGADTSVDFVKQIGGKANQIAIVLETLGLQFYEEKFALKGSSQAMTKVLEDCNAG